MVRAYVELMEQGYPGPAFSDLEPWALLQPLLLLDGTVESKATEDDLRLRTCLLAARRLRIEQLSDRGPVGDDWDLLVQRVAACSRNYIAVHNNHAQFCAVAALESAMGKLSKRRRKSLNERCAEPIVSIGIWEDAIAQNLPDPPEPDEPDSVRSPFERAYQSALRKSWRLDREREAATLACTEEHDCSHCREVLRRLRATGQTAAATKIISAIGESATDDCRQALATVAAWSQDWHELDGHLSGLAEPLPEWARDLALYRHLQSVAAGETGLVMPDFAQFFVGTSQEDLLRFAAEALARAAQAFRQPADVAGTAAWLVKTSMQPEIVAAGEPALAVGLAFLWALSPQETVFDFMDEVLRQTGDSVADAVVTRIGIEILSVAAREWDVERLQQALVLLRRVVDSERRRVPCHEAEFFLCFAKWLDLTMSGQNEKALRRFKDRLNILRARLPKCAAARLRGLTVINLLAAAMVQRGGAIHELGPYLSDLETRNVTYHILWANQYLEQRQTARARAVLQWCEHEALVPEATAACQLWRAYLHELVGEPALADDARGRATEILGDSLESTVKGRILLLVEGERRVGFALSSDGRLVFRTNYSPAFFLVPLPRVAAIPGTLSP